MGSERASPTFQSYDLTKGLKRLNNWSVDDTSTISSTTLDRSKNYSIFTRMIAEFLGDFTFVFVVTTIGKQAKIKKNPKNSSEHCALEKTVIISSKRSKKKTGYVCAKHDIGANEILPYFYFF
ncbi:hypothetical protein Y032_0079g1227 [Ancylostoma ceylanicum]|uniref:Uncharacterized protein n=1 Tax=Ancylostoma ceylanicum TaxID=53326 RepID=A0A016TT78_9BILA|nr:hypothetical protein Y032_0079g1227 [Ancylostoma ceylanicum]